LGGGGLIKLNCPTEGLLVNVMAVVPEPEKIATSVGTPELQLLAVLHVPGAIPCHVLTAMTP
jgi:hypothetical protein